MSADHVLKLGFLVSTTEFGTKFSKSSFQSYFHVADTYCRVTSLSMWVIFFCD